MNQLTVHGFVVDVVRKNIKNLHLAVYPPSGRVRVAAPLCVNDEAVRLAVVSRLGWIKRQKSKFTDQERQSPREFVSGESHYFLGGRYLLKVIFLRGSSRVVCRNKTIIDLYVREGSDAVQRGRVFSAWYRAQLKDQVQPLVAKWEGIVGVRVAECSVKQMKTRWGTCNTKARRIWLNLELVKKPVHCLEYIIVHEMVHFLVRHHNDRFTALMDKFMPHWRHYREELNRAPLGHETWGY